MVDERGGGGGGATRNVDLPADVVSFETLEAVAWIRRAFVDRKRL